MIERFCGKCGAQLDAMTGLCPNCDASRINKKTKKPKRVQPLKFRQKTALGSEKPLDKKQARKDQKVAKKALNKSKEAEKWASMTFGQKCRKMILRFFLWIMILIFLAVGVLGGLSYFNVIDIPWVTAYREGTLLEFISTKNIVIEESHIKMTSDTEGIAEITVQIPNYTLLFREAASASNPEQYLLKALFLKQYEMQEFEATAHVTVENGSTILQSDDVVHQILTEALVDAINALSEVK